MSTDVKRSGYPSIDKPWSRYFRACDGGKEMELPNETIYEYLKKCNQDNLDGYALEYFGHTITYREFFERVDLLAKALIAHGIHPGDIVSIVTTSSVESYELMYACNRVGAVFNFVNFLTDHNTMVHFFQDSEAEYVFCLDLFADKTMKAADEAGFANKYIVFSLADEMPEPVAKAYSAGNASMDRSFYNDPRVMDYKEFKNKGEGQPEISVRKDPDAACAMVYTGGTSGIPKPVLLKDVSLNANAAVYLHYQPLPHGPAYCINTIPSVFAFGCNGGMHTPMCCKATQAIMPKFEPDKWPEYFKKYNPAYVVAVPAFINPMLEDPRMDGVDMSNLIILGIGGDGCTTTFEENVNAFIKAHGCRTEMVKGYGMSEVGAAATTTYPPYICKGNVPVNAIGSVGFPHPMNEFVIWDNDNQQECQYNQIGEVCLRCPTEMIGYKDREEETEAIYQTHPDGKRWIHSSDLGYFNEDGLLFITGRMKRLIITVFEGAAYKVYPSIPEDALALHPAVSEVCVVGMKNDKENKLKAFISLRNDEAAEETDKIEEELREIAKKELSDHEQPKVYEFRKSLPLTDEGKIDYKLLEKEA